MKNHIFSGCATALITPFSEDLKKIDCKTYERLIEYQLLKGTDALVVAGTTGESPVLSKDEKLQLIKTAVNTAHKKIPVIAGTGSNNTEEAVRKSNDAEKQGVDGLLIVTPYYNKTTQEGIIEHYFYIADRVSTPIIVYNVPSRTGFDIKPETYKALCAHKNISGIKEAGGNISAFLKTMSLCRGKIDIYSGNDDQTGVMMSHGAAGVISVAANIIPDIMHELCSAFLKGDFKIGCDLQLKYLELMNGLFTEVNPIPVKAAAELLFGISCRPRLPLPALCPQKREKLKQLMLQYGLL